MALREKNGPFNIAPSGTTRFRSNGGSWASGSTWGGFGFHSWNLTGKDIPDFHLRKERGDLLPHTAFNHFERSLTYVNPRYVSSRRLSDGDTRDYENFNPFAVMTNGGEPFLYHQPDMAYAGAELQRAAANIMSEGFDALTFFAEWNKTVDMFRSMSRRLQLLSTNRGRIRSAKELYRLWLEGRYGWSILARDAQSIHSALADFDENRNIWSNRSGYTTFDSSEKTYSTSSATAGLSYVFTEKAHTEHSIRGSVTAMIEVSRFRTSLPNTLWETLPLSFVVDWVLTVGNAINSASLSLLSEGVTASIGHRSESNVSNSVAYEPSLGWELLSHNAELCKYRVVAKSRIPKVIPLVPQVSGRLLRPSQLLDLSAIVKLRGALNLPQRR